MTRLPRSIDELRGLRAARWIRESTAGQFDRYGPDSQREQQDAFMARFGLVDTGLVYTVAHSGRTVWRSAAMEEMLAAAGVDFDVILAGYFDRWQRNTRRTIEIVEDRLHPAGAAWVMCDRRLLSSDPRDWREMRKLASEAEEYSEKLGERITDGYGAKFRRFADQAGNPPLGFRRSAEPPHVLEIDPASIGRIVALFEAYAAGNRSMDELASAFGLGTEQVRKALGNPLYNGFVRRHRGPDEHRAPATWRGTPPVSDELWARVQELRRARARGQLTRRTARTPDLLGGLLFCSGCRRPLTSDGLKGEGRRRRLHREPCATWGSATRRASSAYEVPIAAQLAGIRLGQGDIVRLAAALTTPRRDDLTRARLEREKRSLVLDVAAGRIGDEAYLARIATLRAQIESIDRQPARDGIDVDVAIGYVRNLAAAWRDADDDARTELAHAVYARIEVTPDAFRRIELTPEAYRHGLQAVLPRSVRVAMAPPAGARNAVTTVRLPIDERAARVARSA